MVRLRAFAGGVRIAARSETVRLSAGLMAIGVMFTAALPAPFHFSAICGRVSFSDVPTLLATGLDFPSVPQLAIGWLAMTLAMMPLLVVGPLAHVRCCSLPRRRFRATSMFIFGYGVCWMMAGAFLAPVALLLAIALEPSAIISAVLLTALCWSASPIAQIARNRCHRTFRIGAFGRAADRDCFGQGIATGTACIGTCWIWMLLPALARESHLVTMTLVTVVLLADRLSPARPPSWRIPPILEWINVGLLGRTQACHRIG